MPKEKDQKKKIVIVHAENTISYPPVVSLIDNLLKNGHFVYMVGQNVFELPNSILRNQKFEYTDIPVYHVNNFFERIIRRRKKEKNIKNVVEKYMKNADIVWTTTDSTILCLGPMLLRYRHIMQLMELDEWYPVVRGLKFPRFPIDKYARNAWKTVVPEINRAYIQKTWWNLEQIPYVLPNKPYRFELGSKPKDMDEVLEKIKRESKRIIIYLGAIVSDRNLEEFAKAIEKKQEEYGLYVVGKVFASYQERFYQLLKDYPFIQYMGYFQAPKHLAFLKYAYIGLLPYVPNKVTSYISELNALYCAPNKIFEYAGAGIPMIGTDVPGLRQPFEQYDIGVCCKKLTSDAIIDAILQVEKRHDEMSTNCKKFYDSVDLDKIVEDILYEEV